MNRPVVSERFDVDDIRRIREYNSVWHAKYDSGVDRCGYEKKQLHFCKYLMGKDV